MIRSGAVLVTLVVGILLAGASPANAHATCSSHTHWTSLTNYTVQHGCSGVIRTLTWRGWKVTGYFTGR